MLPVSSTAYGKIAEHSAIADLLARGHSVFVPIADDEGVDLIVNYRTTVQVKNAMRGTRYAGPSGSYGYEALAWSSHRTASRRPWTEADVFMLHAHGDWFIVPADALKGRGTTLQVYFGSRRHERETVAVILNRYRDAWWVFDDLGSPQPQG